MSDALAAIEPAHEAWWSPHVWRESYRRSDAWVSSCAAVIDIDSTAEGDAAPEDDVDALCMRVRSSEIPGALFHLTPHGARVVFPLDEQCIDRDAMVAAMRGACALVAGAIEGLNYRVDEGASCDLARFFYTPNSIAKGVARRAFVVQMNPDAWTVEDLARHAPRAEAPVTATLTAPTVQASSDYAEAVARFNADHPLNIERHSGRCPVCEHNDCFGYLPTDNQRWFCWSTNHSGVGVRSSRGWHGDSLDLFAHENGVNPVTVLVRMGYLAPRQPAAPTTGEGTELVRRSGIRSRSFESCYHVIDIESNGDSRVTYATGEVLRGRSLRFNEMTGVIELGVWSAQGQPTVTELTDADVLDIRRRIETYRSGGVDGDGNQTGLVFSKADVQDAIALVANEHTYHPVRDYLSSLAWDSVSRIDRIASEILGAADSSINRAMMRKTLISAVARVMDPGCKVDTMLVLQGKQGAMKSTFWSVLASPWFVDTRVDISADITRALQVMRRAWILEWAELATVVRAKDQETIKSFLSSREDTYIPKYGRNPVVVKRSGIIVGTINPAQFLDDETGARRYWIINCGEAINIALLREWRDSIWAEAVAAYLAGEHWWLTREEETELAVVHEEHRVVDIWEDVVITWADAQEEPFTTGDVLARAILKPHGQWNRADEMRISKILKAHGWERRSIIHRGTKRWVKAQAQTSLPVTGDEPAPF